MAPLNLNFFSTFIIVQFQTLHYCQIVSVFFYFEACTLPYCLCRENLLIVLSGLMIPVNVEAQVLGTRIVSDPQAKQPHINE